MLKNTQEKGTMIYGYHRQQFCDLFHMEIKKNKKIAKAIKNYCI